MKLEKQQACHGGTISYYSHNSAQTKTPMRFSLFLPKGASDGTSVPYIVFLSGLTCTEDNFTTKANAYKRASEQGIAILAPDTSPRGDDVADDEGYDLGQGAGFYINAAQEPWAQNFRMESYIIEELLPLVESNTSLTDQKSIMGHSMGGHGALTLYFKYPALFQSCSAFSPIVAPCAVPWGHKAFGAYLGDDRIKWEDHDACKLVARAENAKDNAVILIDQGSADNFLEEQLKPHLFEAACAEAGQALTLRVQEGYDHSYFFIQSFIDDHIDWHVKAMNA